MLEHTMRTNLIFFSSILLDRGEMEWNSLREEGRAPLGKELSTQSEIHPTSPLSNGNTIEICVQKLFYL